MMVVTVSLFQTIAVHFRDLAYVLRPRIIRLPLVVHRAYEKPQGYQHCVCIPVSLALPLASASVVGILR